MKLQFRLQLIILPCGILTICFICWVAYSAMFSHATRNIAERSAMHLALMGADVWESHAQSDRIVDQLAESPAVTGLMSGSPEFDRVTVLAELRTSLSNQSGTQYLAIVDAAGKELAWVSAPGLPETFRQEVLPKLLSGLNSAPSPLHVPGTSSEQESALDTGHLVYHKPLFPAEDSSQSAGTLIQVATLTGLNMRLQSDPQWLGELYFRQADGSLLSGSDSVSAGSEPQLQVNEQERLDMQLWNENIALYDSTALVGIYRLPADLKLLSHVSKSQISGSFGSLFYLIAFVTTFGTFGGIFSFLALQRRMVLQPLIRVQENAMAIGLKQYEGFESTGGVLDRGDEIGDLSRAIDTTHKRLMSTIGQLEKSQSENERLAYLDNLTDLPNRRLFQKRARAYLSEARDSGRNLSVLFMDLDNFKNINDIHGHDSGDQLLIEVSRRLREVLGYNRDIESGGIRLAARLGGDEFIFMVETGAEAQSGRIAQELLDVILQPMTLNNSEHMISASVGIAHFPGHGDCIESLITCADTAMYEAKRRNKNGFAIYHEDMHDSLAEKVSLEADLRHAVERGELRLHYQPKYEIASRTMMGAEALIRWQHPTRGTIPPNQFIHIAEECGQIHEIGAWVIDEACRQWRHWQDSGTPLSHVAVNVSSRQFEKGDLRRIILDALRRHGCPPQALEIELTESCVMEAYDEISETLSLLRKDGVSIAVDDFGTGYSSLALISNMPVQTLKIDRAFVTGMRNSDSNGKIVATLVRLAEQLSLKVVAEGIEEEDELEYLQELSCDFGQGYFLSMPLDVSSMSCELERIQRIGRRPAA